MKHIVLLIVLASGLSACSSSNVQPADSPVDLLSGHALFGETIDVSDIQADAVMALNDELRGYVTSKVGGERRARNRLQKLVAGMIDDGLLALDYNADETHSAIDTFNTRQGNCLSFSILFAALAREAGLDLTFQMVDIPPNFRADGEMIFLNNHINIRIKGLKRDSDYSQDYIVDFNTAQYNENYDTREVDDSYAIALFFGNLAVEALLASNPRESFRYLKKGIETNPEVAEIWVNLGVLYSQHQKYNMAERAYLQALSIQPTNRSALVNMASALHKLGREHESQYYSDKVRYYRDHHPYYFFHRAKTAFREARFDEALKNLNAAIDLKNNEHQFYFLRGLVHKQLKDYDLAEKDFKRARDSAHSAELVSGYTRKLQTLETQLR